MENTTSPVYIGVDTGNRCMKTANHVFVAGLSAISKDNSIFRDPLDYNGVRYALSQHRGAYAEDKTGNDDYFVLTLFAIQKELETRGIDTRYSIPVVLCVGLPPRDFARLRESFRTYFNRGVVQYAYNSIPRQIEIRDVNVYPQGIAAITPLFQSVKTLHRSHIIDIGGYTTDIIELQYGRMDPSLCTSLDRGMIHLYNSIIQRIASEKGVKVTEDDVDKMLETNMDLLPQKDLMSIVRAEALAFVSGLAAKLFELGIDLRVSRGVFVGGGALRLKPYITADSERIINPMFVDSIHANACGYESIAMAALRTR